MYLLTRGPHEGTFAGHGRHEPRLVMDADEIARGFGAWPARSPNAIRARRASVLSASVAAACRWPTGSAGCSVNSRGAMSRSARSTSPSTATTPPPRCRTRGSAEPTSPSRRWAARGPRRRRAVHRAHHPRGHRRAPRLRPPARDRARRPGRSRRPRAAHPPDYVVAQVETRANERVDVVLDAMTASPDQAFVEAAGGVRAGRRRTTAAHSRTTTDTAQGARMTRDRHLLGIEGLEPRADRAVPRHRRGLLRRLAPRRAQGAHPARQDHHQPLLRGRRRARARPSSSPASASRADVDQHQRLARRARPRARRCSTR